MVQIKWLYSKVMANFIGKFIICILKINFIVMVNTLDSRIVVDENITSGKARIADTRITVKAIAIRHELLGHSAEEIASDYGLSLADIYTALAYYYTYKGEIEASIKEEEVLVQKLKKEIPSKLK